MNPDFIFGVELANGESSQIRVNIGCDLPPAECLRMAMDVVPDDAVIQRIDHEYSRII